MMFEDVNNSFNQTTVIECLTKQLSELELFQTMYTPKEITVTHTQVIDDIRDFITKKAIGTPNHLDYTIIQGVENLKLEISIHLPSFYPVVAPEIYVRCNQLNRHQEKNLNDDLTEYIQSKQDGEVCIFTAIIWLQDNIESYATKMSKVDPVAKPKVLQNICRYWIYSHHIYSKKKTEEITKLSKDLDLTGFCLLGKPGVICVEGNADNCKEWWKNVKTLQWQKISLRMTETCSERNAFQKKFKKFDVISFPSTISNTTHSNLGSFQKYLYTHGLQHQATEFFSVWTQ